MARVDKPPINETNLKVLTDLLCPGQTPTARKEGEIKVFHITYNQKAINITLYQYEILVDSL